VKLDRNQKLANVANSVSGFYKDQASEYSNMSRTGENFAANMIHNPRRSVGVQQQNQD